MAPSVTISELEVRYADRVALTGLNLSFDAPSSVAVIGPNGSGKSTLLGAITGLVPPSSGSVTVDAPTAPALVLQATNVDRSLPISVRDTVRLARFSHLGLLGRPSPVDRALVEHAMQRLDVLSLIHI